MSRVGRPGLLRWSRQRRVTTVLLALLHLLFMQIAVASYRCPMGAGMLNGIDTGGSSAAAAVAAAVSTQPACNDPMPAGIMDPDLPNLCQAHCLIDAQANSNTDKAQALALALPGPPPATFAGTVSTTNPPQPRPLRPPATAPPLAIRHCCWRI
jgi:hypothetical protein